VRSPSLISVTAIAAMGTVGGKVSNVLSNVANAMTETPFREVRGSRRPGN